jgi:hypothetical protein
MAIRLWCDGDERRAGVQPGALGRCGALAAWSVGELVLGLVEEDGDELVQGQPVSWTRVVMHPNRGPPRRRLTSARGVPAHRPTYPRFPGWLHVLPCSRRQVPYSADGSLCIESGVIEVVVDRITYLSPPKAAGGAEAESEAGAGSERRGSRSWAAVGLLGLVTCWWLASTVGDVIVGEQAGAVVGTAALVVLSPLLAVLVALLIPPEPRLLEAVVEALVLGRAGRVPRLLDRWRGEDVEYTRWEMPVGVTLTHLQRWREVWEQGLNCGVDVWY